MSTIRDVAKLAGVSPATVSRVFTGNSNTSPEVKVKVEQAIKQLGYIPSSKSQQQSSNTSKTICFTVAREPSEFFGNPFFDDVLLGISKAVERRDFNLQLAVFHTVDQQIDKCLRLYRQNKADGFILSGVLSADKDKMINSLQQNRVPFVLIGRSLHHNVFNIQNDNFRDGYITVLHLLEEGYRNIVFLAPSMNQDVIRDRIEGYHRALQDNGLEMNSIVQSESNEAQVYTQLQQLKQQGVPFDAIIASDSIIALSALKYCQQHKLRVPEDIGIIGFNDVPFLSKISPSISCLNLKGEHLGAEAFELLMELLDDPEKMNKKKTITFPSEAIIRESTQRNRGQAAYPQKEAHPSL